MTNLPNQATLTLISPTSTILNNAAYEVTYNEINTPYIQSVIDCMIQLAEGKGSDEQDSRQMVGLAALQLGVNKCIIIIDVTADGSKKDQNLTVFINPKITYRSKETLPGREGCWSCGNICGNVERAKSVTLEGLDRHGAPIKAKLTDFVARIAQHETDHLAGIRFPDRIPKNRPEHLHLVKPVEFERYRKEWEHWPNLCPRERWDKMKSGQ